MDSAGQPPTSKQNWARRIVIVAGVITVSLILFDVMLYDRIVAPVKGMDYVVVALAAAFLLIIAIRRKLAAKLSVAVLVSLVVLALAEGLIGILMAPHGRDFAWYVSPPNHKIHVQPTNLIGIASDGAFSTNSQGLRGPEFSKDDDYRILCIGGSTTECLYLDDRAAWPALLADGLNDEDERVWVGNAGRAGLNSYDHIVLVKHLPEARQVDMWLVMVGINDFSHMATGRSAIYKPRAWYRTFRYRRPTLWDSPTRPIHRNLYCWNVLENLRKRMKLAFKGEDWMVYQDARAEWYDDYCKKRWHAPKTDTLPDLAPMLDEYEQNMMSILGHAKRFGIAVVVTTQPALYQQSMPEEFERITYGGGPLADGSFFSSSAMARGLEAFNERLRAFAKRENVPLVDLARLMPKTTESFYDECHFNTNGADLVAQYVTPTIKKLVDQKADTRGRQVVSGE